MNKAFEKLTTPEIDAKLAYDTLRHWETINKYAIIALFILIFIFRGFIWYWIRFGIALPSGYSKEIVTVWDEPKQINYTDEEKKEKTFVYTSLINNHKITIIPQASYELSGLTVAKNHDFLFISDFFDSAALFDLGASWGEIGDKNIYNKYFKSYSSKTELTGSRILWIRAKTRDLPYSNSYIISHFSHSHIVPANRNIMAALLKVKKCENIKIEGELIDMEYKNSRGRTKSYHTSMTRGDTHEGDRGNGSCETVYVTKVQIGHKIYE